MELWRPIKNYENLYEISNLGRVKSLHNNSSRILKPQFRKSHSGNYYFIQLSNNKKIEEVSVHRLVAEAFCQKPITDKMLVVNHKNGRKLDNRANNLEWVTQSENVKHAFRTGLAKPTNTKKVLCVEKNIIFDNSTKAIEFIQDEMGEKRGHSRNIRRACQNGGTAYKYHWKFII